MINRGVAFKSPFQLELYRANHSVPVAFFLLLLLLVEAWEGKSYLIFLLGFTPQPPLFVVKQTCILNLNPSSEPVQFLCNRLLNSDNRGCCAAYLCSFLN